MIDTITTVRRLTQFEVKDITEKNAARKSIGLPLIKVRVRSCISCRRLFESTEKRSCGCISSDTRWLPSLSGREIY